MGLFDRMLDNLMGGKFGGHREGYQGGQHGGYGSNPSYLRKSGADTAFPVKPPPDVNRD